MKKTVIIVAYNTKIDFIKNNIDKLVINGFFVIICNNGDVELKKLENINVKVFDFNGNKGIAEAQSIGMKYAFSTGSDYIIQADDDSELDPNLINGLIQRYEKLRNNNINVGLIAPKHFDKVDKIVDEKRLPKGKYLPDYNVMDVHAVISSCSVISKDVYDIVGGMDDSLFIDYVDWEYCWRLKSAGYKVFRAEDLLLPHRVGNGTKKIIGNMNARIPSLVRHYYHSRNTIVLFKRSYSPRSIIIKELIKLPLKIIVYPFIFKNGFERSKYILSGVFSGIKGKSGSINNEDIFNYKL